MNERRARWQALRPFAVRIGVSSGELLRVGGEFNGLPMAEADRLQSVAEPGQIVCTAGTAALTGGRLDDDIRPIGARCGSLCGDTSTLPPSIALRSDARERQANRRARNSSRRAPASGAPTSKRHS